MFVTVKYGADDQKLFNPDCALRLLVDSIRRRCYCPAGTAVALADEKWNIVHLCPYSMENASSLFADRAVYILLTVEMKENGPPKYTSLLDDTDQELVAKLEALSNPKAGSRSHLQPSRACRRLGKQTPAIAKTKRTNSSCKTKGKSCV